MGKNQHVVPHGDDWAVVRYCLKFIWNISASALLILILSVAGQAGGNQDKKFQFDLQGDVHYSRYNFTDIKEPYDGVDGWTELKISYWLDGEKTFSPWLSVIPVFTTEGEFWWQRNVQVAAGLQWYPFTANTFYLRSIRLFVLSTWRDYYNEPDDVDAEDTDIQIGGDYYYDNLFDDRRLTTVAWTNAGFRKTNFSFDNYDTLLWTGNIKVGPKFKRGKSILLPYAVTDWTYVPRYEERWWENFLRIGAGVRWYPKTDTDQAVKFVQDLIQRFHIYTEVLHNVAWLGDEPNADSVKETDFRIGFGFSTSGFFKE